MNFLVVGLSHKTAPVEVREQMAVSEGALSEALTALLAHPGVNEAMILSTCNRVELVVRTEPGADTVGEIYSFLANERRFAIEKADRYLYRYQQRDAIRHLFRVASSLDS